jgi:hypothetical protein
VIFSCWGRAEFGLALTGRGIAGTVLGIEGMGELAIVGDGGIEGTGD